MAHGNENKDEFQKAIDLLEQEGYYVVSSEDNKNNRKLSEVDSYYRTVIQPVFIVILLQFGVIGYFIIDTKMLIYYILFSLFIGFLLVAIWIELGKLLDSK